MRESTSHELESNRYESRGKAGGELGPNERSGLWLERLVNGVISRLVSILDKIDDF